MKSPEVDQLDAVTTLSLQAHELARKNRTDLASAVAKLAALTEKSGTERDQISRDIVKAQALIDQLQAHQVELDRALVDKAMTPGPKGDRGEQGLTGERGNDGVGLQGERGEVGPKGQRGQRGLAGADGKQGDAGRSINWRREWDASSEYAINDAVSYLGSSWIAVAPSLNDSPPSEAWDPLALRGEPGANGSQGSQGPQGIPGIDGEDGEDGTGGGAAATFSAENKEGATILAGQVVATHSSGTGVVLASAADTTEPAVGLMLDDTLNAVAGDVQTDGILTMADWTDVIGSASLTRGLYFLSLTPGMLTATAPSIGGQIQQPVGYAISPNDLDISIQSSILL